jgi:hypothetical protein
MRIFISWKCTNTGTHHSKFAILFYGGRGVRIMITTANFNQSEWEEMTEARMVYGAMNFVV